MKIKLINELQVLLEQIPALINKYESDDSSFPEASKQWLRCGEKLLTTYHKSQVSVLAGLRGSIVAAERGVYESSFAFDPKIRKRKASAATAVFSLNKAQEILQTILNPVIGEVEEARTLIKQVLVLADQKNILTEYMEATDAVTKNLLTLWSNLSKTEDIRVGLNRILTLVSHAEALKLMEETLHEWPTYS
jgi:hypothetical protein